MSIMILIDPPKNVRPKGALRADVAWKLFLPDVMVIGIGSLGYLMAGLTSMLIDIRLSSKLGERMAAEKKHIVLCNYNESTKKVLERIKYDGIDIVILNENEIKGDNEYTFVKGSFLRENDLIRAGIKKASSVIIFSRAEDKDQMGMDAENILSAMIIRKLNPEIRIIGEILNPDSREHASSFMDDIIIKGDVSSMLIYSSIMIPGIPEFINDLLTSDSISEEDVDKGYMDRTYSEFIHIMEKENKIVLAFRNPRDPIPITIMIMPFVLPARPYTGVSP